MTKEEAIIFVETLKTVIKDIPKYNGSGIDKSLDMVIEALKQEVSEDAINQQWKERLDKIKAEIESMDYLHIEDGSDGYDNYVDRYDVLQIIDKYKAESEDEK